MTLFSWLLETENKHLSRDPQLSSVTQNCQIYSMQLDTLKTGFFFKLKEFMDIIIVIIGYWLDMEIYVRILVRCDIFITYAFLQKKLNNIYYIIFINKK